MHADADGAAAPAPDGQQLRLSVVVPTRDRPDHLGPCLDSIHRSLRPGDELIVADSASADAESVRRAAEERGGRYLRCDLPGASRARNMGWRAAVHDIVVFVDDDMLVSEGWADGYRAAFEAHPEAPFMFGRVEVPEHQTAERPVAQKSGEEAQVLDGDFFGTPGHSANMAVRRVDLEAVGGFDERFGAGADFKASEDADLFDRLLARGLVGRYEPAANGWHQQWRHRGELMRLDWNYGFGGGARIRKLLRTNPRRARQEARMTYWIWGMQEVIYFSRVRRKWMAATALVRVVGAGVGFVRTLPVGVRDGHWAPAIRIRGRRG